MTYKIFGAFLVVVGLILLGTVVYKNRHKQPQTIVYSPTLMLSALWNSYKENYWESSTGRTIDKQRGNITTSEGQSYTMLRAVWQDDKPVFDKTWQWTQANLQHPSDKLFSWLYGTKNDGSYGILTDKGGENSASDADSDIALALIFASARWQDQNYYTEAKDILTGIWSSEVVTATGTPYLAANNLEKKSSDKIVLNPSYFAPYSYRIFAGVDPDHNWNGLIDSSYQILAESSSDPLDKQTSVGLPPDWVLLNLKTGKLEPGTVGDLSSNFSYDALRTPWRIALDGLWNQEPRAKTLLEKFSFLAQQWSEKKQLASAYQHDGTVITQFETPAMYGGTIGYFLLTNPSMAETVYKQKLQDLYDPDIESWKKTLSYYDDNWAWFGIALYNNRLLDLAGPHATTTPN